MKKALFLIMIVLLLSLNCTAQTTFTKITSVSELEAGALYIIVGYDEDLGYCAMGYQKSNNRHAISVIENGGSITVFPAYYHPSQTEVYQFTLGGNANAWTFYDDLNEGYLYASSSSSNQLKTQTTLDNNGKWAITFNADGTAEVIAQGENTRNNMRFNPNTSNDYPLFSSYASTSFISTRIRLYKAENSITPEPTNYPTNLEASVNGVDVTLTWIDSEGGQLPAKYLVVASTDNINVPTDGVPVLNYSLVMNVNYGVQTMTFCGLESATTYHFAIFPYTNSGDNTDYKTDGNYPIVSATTKNMHVLLFEDFNNGLGVFSAYNAYGEEVWHQVSDQLISFAYMNGYNGSHKKNEDWLISPLVVSSFQDVILSFRTAMKFDGDPIQVKISAEYDGQSNPSDFFWINITDAFIYSTGNFEWVESGSINIWDIFQQYGAFNNPNFYVAFVYTSTTEAASVWEIDYVKVVSYENNSIEENNQPTISLYPNPTSATVNFTLDSDAEVSIINITGCMATKLNATAGDNQLNVSELEKGVYFVYVHYANGRIIISKFVKY